ncbi:RcnB family protein [Ottowia sp.]|uniref:RcnB family protein n=1 Tax=Ottowia sp. TaxID=1898956 RepID=UPI0039E554EF
MRTHRIIAVALAASLGLPSLAGAQPGDPERRPGDPPRKTAPAKREPNHARAPQQRQPAGQPAPHVARGAGPDHRFHQGQRLPSEWRHQQYVVNDWRAHHLRPPPRGYQWVQVGADYVLIAVATGVIASLILSN